ncbi:M48 family metallopeptidase [Arthrobacter sp. UYCu723]
MNTTSAYLTVSGIDVDVIYKNIKNLHIAVYPPMGRVRVAAPDRLDDEAIRLAIVQRLPWIKKQRQQLRDAERQTAREMVTGESHYVWGRRYRLQVEERPGHTKLEVTGARLQMKVSPTSSTDQRLAALDRWHRIQLKEAIPEVIARWEPIIGREVPKWTVRRMKTKWGTCNRESGHIWLNLELAKKSPRCLEYIVVHEMAHYLQRSHDDAFVALMDRFLPDWRSRRDELNAAPLADEKWGSQ